MWTSEEEREGGQEGKGEREGERSGAFCKERSVLDNADLVSK